MTTVLKMARGLSRIVRRGNKHSISVSETAEQFYDVDRVTLQTLKKGKYAKIKLLTLPHRHLLKDQSDFETIAEIARDSIFVFNFDPVKPVHELRKIRSKGVKHLRKIKDIQTTYDNVLELSDAREALFESCLFRYLVAPLTRHKRKIDDHFELFQNKFITDENLNFCNSNVRTILFYLAIVCEGNPLIAFGGYPETLFRAKLAQLTSKDLLFNAYLSLLQKLEKNDSDLSQFLGVLKMDSCDLVKHRFDLNTHALKAKYLYEYSKSIAESSEDDVVIVVDPFIKYYVSAWARQDDPENDFFSIDSSAGKKPESKIQHLLAFHLRNLFSETWVEQIENQGFLSNPRYDNSIGMFEHSNLMIKINAEFAKMGFSELNSIKPFEDLDDPEIPDTIFKMALLDVINETTLYESDFVSSQFYYINRNSKAFTRRQFDEMRKRFYVNYQGIKRISDRFLHKNKKKSQEDRSMDDYDSQNFEFEESKFTGIFDLDSA